MPERWLRALEDARPEVRAAAARAVNLAQGVALVPRVVESLAKETDVTAAAEEIRAAAALGGPQADGPVIEAAKRFGPKVGGVAAESLAASRGTAALEALKSLRELITSQNDRTRFYILASRREVGPLTRAASQALALRDPELWEAVLRAVRLSRVSLGASLLATGLKDEISAIRLATCWHLALVGPLTEAEAPMIRDALRALPQTDEAELRFGLEMARRALEAGPAEVPASTSWLRDSGAPRLPADWRRWRGWLGRLDHDERQALSLRLGQPADGLEDLAKSLDTSEDSLKVHPLRTAAPPPAGFVGDLLALTGCRPGKEDGKALARVTWGPDRRPRAVELDVSGWTLCGPVVRTLLLWSLAKPVGGMEILPAEMETLTAPADASFLACLDDGPTDPAPESTDRPSATSRKIQEPRKVRDVKPRYPEGAASLKKQGVVILELNVTPRGCVNRVEVLKGAMPALDFAALDATAGWQYTPTLLDGRPVPMTMTATVNFKVSSPADSR